LQHLADRELKELYAPFIVLLAVRKTEYLRLETGMGADL
jgi:hypothetical protein